MNHEHHNHDHGHGNSNSMALSATLHCFTGCAIGEMTGLIIGTSLGWAAMNTTILAVSLAFLFGYLLSVLPLLKASLSFFSALKIVLAADTLSILTMEIVDNGVMMLVPGAMESGLGNPLFWLTMSFAFLLAFLAAYPVNKYLLNKNKGHALTHRYHSAPPPNGVQRFIWVPSSQLLLGLLVGFFTSGLLVSMLA